MITVVGEVLVDLVVAPDWSCRASPGGAPANVAVALARLGRDVSLRARLSGDGFGMLLRRHLAVNGVSERGLVTAAEPTTIALATLDAAGQASYSFYLNGTADWMWREQDLAAPLGDDVRALYLGSLASALPPGAVHVESLARRTRSAGKAVVIYDPNLRPGVAPGRDAERERVERQVACAHVVKASADDLAWLYPDEGVSAVARRWQRLGRGLIVVTLGAGGAYGLGERGTEVTIPAPNGAVTDTIGAGDAFSAGLIDAMAGERLLGPEGVAALPSLPDSMIGELLGSAALVASMTCERSGADPPRKSEVLARRGHRGPG